MRVRIVREALGTVNGVSLRHYRAHQVYDLPPSLANYLVAQGTANFEMRNEGAAKPPDQVERRRPVSGH
jgi:hypothetical protein